MRILIALLAIAAVGAVGWSLRLSRRLRHSERDRRRAADELNRRLSELFSLHELSFILSGSLQLDRIVEQVVRYAMRFLDAQGALVALALDGEPAGEAGAGRENRPLLQVTAADGTLAALAGRAIGADDPGLVVRSLGRERLELVRSSGGEPTRLVVDVQADSAAAVPLRAHGVVVGTLVIANPRGGGFAAEDIRLLSTVATHAAIVIANARFFEMVRHAKEQWETAFDSLSEGIAVVDDAGRVRRANRSFAALLGAPIPGVIGRELVAALVGASPPLVDLLAAARAAVAGLSEFLLEQKERGAKDRGHLRVIHEQAERAGRIVRNLLTFARKGPGEQAPVDLNDVIQRTLLLMSYDLTLKDIAVEKDLGTLPPVLGDRHALQQVLLNLLNNAAQAVAENPPERPRVIRLVTWFDDRVRMRVTDSGAGIPDDVLPHLFTPFFTTKEPGQGTGLGLSITYSIVEAHGGRIGVERPPEGGAAFLVDLPAAPAGVAVHATPVPAPAPAPPAAKRAILLVDDDPAVRRMVK